MSGLWTSLISVCVIGAGVSVALQQVLNANLRMQLGSPWLAGFVSYAVGTLAMIVVVVVTGNRWFSSEMVARTSWMSWSGGIFGAIFITTAVLAVPRLGAATVLALMVVGQMIGSLLFDHFGLFGLPTHVLTPTRLAGAGLLILGTLLVRL